MARNKCLALESAVDIYDIVDRTSTGLGKIPASVTARDAINLACTGAKNGRRWARGCRMCKANDEQQHDSDNQEEREDEAICIGVILDPMTGMNSTILRGV